MMMRRMLEGAEKCALRDFLLEELTSARGDGRGGRERRHVAHQSAPCHGVPQRPRARRFNAAGCVLGENFIAPSQTAS